MGDVLAALTLLAAIGCGTCAGVFFTFSSFVMKALARLRPAQGIAAMQSINVVAVTPVFMTALFGTAAASIGLGVWAIADWDDSYGPYLVAGSSLYLVGTIGLTIAYHVPRNDALEAVDPEGDGADAHWRRYVSDWTRWNHVRAVTAVLAAVAFTQALRV